MNGEYEQGESLHVLEGYFDAADFTAEVMKTKVPAYLDGLLSPNEHETVMIEINWRSVAWANSLAALRSSGHLQVIATAYRALLEILVDLMLLHRDDSGDRQRQHTFWEESARLKLANAAMGYFQGHNLPIPHIYQPYEDFVINEGARIEQERQNIGWGGNHPPRWTRRNLGDDVIRVDALQPDVTSNKFGGDVIVRELGMPLEQIYRTEYSRLNLLIHGAGRSQLTRMSTEHLDYSAALYIKTITDMILLAANIVLTDFGYNRVPDFLVDWAEVKRKKGEIEQRGVNEVLTERQKRQTQPAE